MRYTGVVEIRDLLALMDEVDQETDYVEEMLEFGDMSGLEELRLKVSEVTAIGHLAHGLYRRRSMPERCAFWAPNPKFRISASIYCSVLSTLCRVKAEAFSERDAAIRFLNFGDADVDVSAIR